MVNKEVKEPTRDRQQEHTIQKIGGTSIIIGIIFFTWGCLSIGGWTPGTRYEILKQYETPVFIGFGLLSFLAGGLVMYYDMWGRFLQILLSLAGVAAIATLHPILMFAGLVQVYILYQMLMPRTGAIFGRSYRIMVVDERGDNVSGAKQFLQSINWPIFTVFALVASLLIIVVMVMIFSLQTIQYAEYSARNIKFLTQLGSKEVAQVEKGNYYRVAFTIDYQKVSKKLIYQLYINKQLKKEQTFLPNPDVKSQTIEVPGVIWGANKSGTYEFRVMVFEGGTPNYRASIYTKTVEVKDKVEKKNPPQPPKKEDKKKK